MTTPEQMDQMQRGPWGYASSDISALIAELRAKSERQPLPGRRQNITCDRLWQDHLITVTVGFAPDGSPAEVFANTLRGGAIAASLADAAVLVSIALQHGISPAALAKSLGRVPAWVNGEQVEAPASPVGTILAVVEDIAAWAGGEG